MFENKVMNLIPTIVLKTSRYTVTLSPKKKLIFRDWQCFWNIQSYFLEKSWYEVKFFTHKRHKWCNRLRSAVIYGEEIFTIYSIRESTKEYKQMNLITMEYFTHKACEWSRTTSSNERNIKCNEPSLKRERSSFLNFSQEIAYTFDTKSIESFKFRSMHIKMIDRYNVCEVSQWEKNLKNSRAQSFYICTMFARIGFECTESLSRAQMTVWTIYRNLSFISNERVVTRWAIGRWIYYSFISCSLTDDATHNIRNYLTSTLYKDHIPDSHIFQCNFIIVMQCCSRDSYSTKINWFQ